MRGELHQRLVAAINAKLDAKEITQDSLAAVLEMHQTTVGGILRRNRGTFDLDEAAVALAHIGTSLSAFVAGGPAPARSAESPIPERLLRRLTRRRELLPLIEDLLDVPQTRLPAVLELVQMGVFAATGRRSKGSGESDSGTTKGSGSKRKRSRHRAGSVHG